MVLERVLAANPQLARVEIGHIDGSVDDDAALAAGLLIHRAGLDTHLRADSVVESGGVDLFCAGRRRTAEPGAHVGVHAWAYNDRSKTGFALPADDPDHAPYLDYYAEVGCPTAFYWYTLSAAPYDGMHVMDADALRAQGVVTD